jgi:hypothetical protein
MAQIHGTFLCFGATAEPGVVLLGAYELSTIGESMRIAETRCRNIPEARERVYAKYFYAGVQYAIPAWVPDAMLSIVEHYAGPNSLRIRTLAAMIYEGKHYGFNGDGPSDPKGGQPALLDPVKPKPRKPSGAARIKTPATA